MSGTHGSRHDADEQAEALRVLTSLQRAIFKYPMAVQAAFSALVAEGRSFASTKEGAHWRERLSRAPSAARARMVWEVLSLSAFTEQNDAPLPGVFVDKLVSTLKTRHLEPLLSRVFEKSM